MNIAKYAVGAIAVVIVILAVYFYLGTVSQPFVGLGMNLPTVNTGNTTNITAAIVGDGSGASACPLITYQLNGSITGYSGFSRYYINSSGGEVADYVIGSNSSGLLYAIEHVESVLEDNNSLFTTNRTHYATLTQVGPGFNETSPGLNFTISPETYNVVKNGSMNLTIAVNTRDAENLTYWLRIDGPCGGGVALVVVTVGSKPYSGNLTMPGGVYA